MASKFGFDGSMVRERMQNLEKWLNRTSTNRALDLGAGEGKNALWLAAQGFTVDAVEHDPQVYQRLAAACAGAAVTPHHDDVVDFPLSAYDLIVAQAVLHFLRPTQLWPLADRLVAALLPGAILVAEVFTTDDPGYTALLESNATEIEPNTFEAPAPIGVIHYFAPGELRRIFAPLEVLEYDESRTADPQSEYGFHAGAFLVAQRPTITRVDG
jgi:SAM-dependent methyltransferase